MFVTLMFSFSCNLACSLFLFVYYAFLREIIVESVFLLLWIGNVHVSEVGGGESAAAPTAKSFRFVRACERAGARTARDQLRLPRGFCGMNVFSFFSPGPAFFQKRINNKGLKHLQRDINIRTFFIRGNTCFFFNFFAFFAFSHKDFH